MSTYIDFSNEGNVTYENVPENKRTLFPNLVFNPEGTDSLSITENGNQIINVAKYSSLNLSVNVPPPGNIVDFISYVPQSNLNQNNQATINLTPVPNGKYWFFMMCPSEMPTADSSLYWALGGFDSNTGTLKATPILRPNGTLGTDNSSFIYDASTGALTLGGPYGTYKKGLTYNIYLCVLD